MTVKVGEENVTCTCHCETTTSLQVIDPFNTTLKLASLKVSCSFNNAIYWRISDVIQSGILLTVVSLQSFNLLNIIGGKDALSNINYYYYNLFMLISTTQDLSQDLETGWPKSPKVFGHPMTTMISDYMHKHVFTW